MKILIFVSVSSSSVEKESGGLNLHPWYEIDKVGAWSFNYEMQTLNVISYKLTRGTQIGPKIFLSCDHPAQALSPKQIFFIWDTFLPFFYWPLKMNKRLFILRQFDDWVDTATTLLSLISLNSYCDAIFIWVDCLLQERLLTSAIKTQMLRLI